MSWGPGKTFLVVVAVAAIGFVVWQSTGSQQQPLPSTVRPSTGLTTVAFDQNAAVTSPALNQMTPRLTTESPVTIAQATTTAPAAATPGEDVTPVVDETALRYFARQGDTARLQAEIARLQALYPDWVPPADPLAAPIYTDAALDEMWADYAEGNYADVRADIAARQQREPGWMPPAALLELLAVGEARDRLVAASDARQYETVIVVAAQNPPLLICAEMDVLWRVAEAFALTDRTDRAVDAYTYILQNCDDPAERLATIEKAMGLLSTDDIRTLLAYERTGAGGEAEFAPIRLDLSRTAVAAGAEDRTAIVSDDDIDRIAAAAQNGTDASDALLLGWYYQQREDSRRALPWFRLAHERDENAESAQGLGLALIGLDQPQEAEDVLYPYREDSDEIMAIYLAAVSGLLAISPPVDLTPQVLNRIIATVGEQRDPVAGRQIAWFAYGLNQVQTAAQWFLAALRWNPNDEEAAYGLTIARQRLGDTTGVQEMIRIWGPLSDRIRTVGQAASTTPATPNATIPLPAGATQTTPQVNGAVPQAAAAAPAYAHTPAPATTYAPPAVATAYVQPVTAVPAAQPAAATTTAAVASPARTAVNTSGCTRTQNVDSLSPAQALARGWCLMELDRPMEAAQAFEIALRSNDGATRSDAAYGQSLAYLRAGATDRAAVAATQGEMTAARRNEVQANILAQRAIAAYNDGRYVQALQALDERSHFAGEQNDLMIIRAYSYVHSGQLAAAEAIFGMLANAGYPDALDGLAAVQAGGGFR